MDVAFDETQEAVRNLAVEVLRRETGGDAETGSGEAIWKALGDAGLLALAVPERLGGAGLGVLETAIVRAAVGVSAIQEPARSPVGCARFACAIDDVIP